MPLIHVHTTFPENVLLKQFPEGLPSLGGFDFSFGVEPPRQVDAVIAHRFLMQSFRTTLPQNRLAFICGEPPEIHTYTQKFLDQFGLVVSPYPCETGAKKLRKNYRCVWYAGLSMDPATMWQTRKDAVFFRNYTPSEKLDRIAVIATRKTQTEFHRLREEFILKLKLAFPDKVDIFGVNKLFVEDKFEVLKNYKYTLAAENTETPHCWSEKLSDPLLCWALPLYIGPEANSIDLDPACFVPIDVREPEIEIARIGQLLRFDVWSQQRHAIEKARKEILETKNIAGLFVEVCQELISPPPAPQTTERTILCEQVFQTERRKWRRDLLRLALYAFPRCQILHFNIKNSTIVRTLTTPAKMLRAKIKRRRA